MYDLGDHSMRPACVSHVSHVRNDISSLVAADVPRLNAGCVDSASTARFSAGVRQALGAILAFMTLRTNIILSSESFVL
jgi:hypothetical protein